MTAAETRRQLTLFVQSREAPLIEHVRALVDPVQFGLIAAHVTLCREDEIRALRPETLSLHIRSLALETLRLVFGGPQSMDGHGVLLPCRDGEAAFQQLRSAILAPAIPRHMHPHITLAHPRNPHAAGNTPTAFAVFSDEPLTLTFATVSLIEQHGAQPWRTIARASLGDPRSTT
jgi:hypothetical protein